VRERGSHKVCLLEEDDRHSYSRGGDGFAVEYTCLFASNLWSKQQDSRNIHASHHATSDHSKQIVL
jgi:hypothetical protein